MFIKRHLWAVGYGFVLTAFTLYITLDTFVLRSPYQENATEMNTSMFENISIATGGSIRGNATGSSVSEEVASDRDVTDDYDELDRREDSSSHGPGRSSGRGRGEHSRSKGGWGAWDDFDEGEELPADDSSQQNGTSSEIDTYQDDNVTIKLTEYYENDTRIYVADVTVTSAQYIKTAFADDTYGKNVTAHTSEIAKAHNAILAVNGDFYGAQERGYVIRNGVLYRESANDRDVMCMYADGSIEVYRSNEYTAQELVEKGVWQAFNFGPGLVSDGKISVSENQEVDREMSSNPRTAIGTIDNNHYVFLVADGRSSVSDGLSLFQLAEFMKNLGVDTAYNLDGGGSSTMYYNGEVVNHPTTNGRSIRERGVSDIVYVG